jgi:hypothetical protein
MKGKRKKKKKKERAIQIFLQPQSNR